MSAWPLWVNAMAFAALAGVIWSMGVRLALVADAFAVRLRLGHAVVGLLFLAGLTELPEIVTTAVSSLQDSAALALSNMFGGITMQTAILGVADGCAAHATLTAYPRKPTTILAGTLLILLLTATLVIILIGDAALFAFGHIGVGALALAAGYLLSVYLLQRYDSDFAWSPVGEPEQLAEKDIAGSVFREMSVRRLAVESCLAGMAILGAGILIVNVAGTIAAQSGLGESYVGVTILAATTSLPELSTTIAAARMGAFTMAISNILGSNLIMLLLVLPADVLYGSGLILAAAGRSEQLALLFGILVTAIYLVGLLVKKKPRYFGMGIDSVLVLGLYVVSLFALYVVR